MTNQPSKLAPAATQSDRPCIKSEAYGVSAERCGCPKCAAPQSDLNALIAEAEKLAVTGPFDQLVIRNPELHEFLGKLRACVRRGARSQSDQPAQGERKLEVSGHAWEGTCFSQSGRYGNCQCGKFQYCDYSQHQKHLASLAAPASQPVAPEQPETAWLLERGQLCLGFCGRKFKMVTFTNDEALRFARKVDAERFMWAFWDPAAVLDLKDMTISEHSWG